MRIVFADDPQDFMDRGETVNSVLGELLSIVFYMMGGLILFSLGIIYFQVEGG